ncbi:MAG: hypothetical protein LC792_11925, partial [Actinobacteria bacterium]|nr:hypothetical protein [Actinomycetota bacterium]
ARSVLRAVIKRTPLFGGITGYTTDLTVSGSTPNRAATRFGTAPSVAIAAYRLSCEEPAAPDFRIKVCVASKIRLGAGAPRADTKPTTMPITTPAKMTDRHRRIT